MVTQEPNTYHDIFSHANVFEVAAMFFQMLTANFFKSGSPHLYYAHIFVGPGQQREPFSYMD